MLPLALVLGAHSSVSKMAFFRASSSGPSDSHSVPSLGAAAGEDPQRTRCTCPSVIRGGAAAGAAGSVEDLGTAWGPSATDALVEGAGADALVDGLRTR